jgi:hypothetical protein
MFIRKDLSEKMSARSSEAKQGVPRSGDSEQVVADGLANLG